jgi:hypothetical protein
MIGLMKAISRGAKPEAFTIQLPFFLSSKAAFKELRELEDGIPVEINLGERKALVEK